jgi:hypothetical protein
MGDGATRNAARRLPAGKLRNSGAPAARGAQPVATWARSAASAAASQVPLGRSPLLSEDRLGVARVLEARGATSHARAMADAERAGPARDVRSRRAGDSADDRA